MTGSLCLPRDRRWLPRAPSRNLLRYHADVAQRAQSPRVAAPLPGITTRMTREITYEIIAGRKHNGHGKHQWVYVCEHPDCGRADSPTEHPTTCRDAGCAEKAAWDHARRAHPDDTAVIDIQGGA